MSGNASLLINPQNINPHCQRKAIINQTFYIESVRVPTPAANRSIRYRHA
jgi:hypothetical protein